MTITKASASAKKRKERKLLIMDLIGTIIFTDDATRMAAQKITGKEMLRKDVRTLSKSTKGKIYDLVATEYAAYVQPNEAVIKVMRENKGKMQIIILTADLDKPEVRKGLEQILKNYSVPYDQLIMRRPVLRNVADEKWKSVHIKEITRGYSEISIYEDKIDNIIYFARHLKNDIIYFHVTSHGIEKIN